MHIDGLAGGVGALGHVSAREAGTARGPPHRPTAPQEPIVAPPGEEGPLDPNYLRLFLLKYMCAVPGCFGTAGPPAAGSNLLLGTVCAASRTEEDFLRDLEAAHGN
jgi:hypothetical protein